MSVQQPVKHPVTLLQILMSFCLLGLMANAQSETRGIKIVSTSGEQIGGYGKSYALVIGVSHYTNGWPSLNNVVPEMEQVSELLRNKGFEVTSVYDPSGDQMEDAFDDFVDLYGYEKTNRLLVYFAGHGYTRNNGNKGYLVPADAPDPRKDERGFLRKAFAMTDLTAMARRMEANHVLFLFDSCFSGTIFKTRALKSQPDVISRLTAAPVRQFITAGDAGEEVPARSVFTPAFIDSLRYGLGDLNSDGFVTGTELGLYLQHKVPQHAQQTPQFGKINDYELSRGDFVFAVKSLAPRAKAGAGETQSRDLTGKWTGRYYYQDGRKSVPFAADIYDIGGDIEGRISEPNTFAAAKELSLFAQLRGQFEGDRLRFVKTYDGTGGQRHSILYTGKTDAELMTIKGKWTLQDVSGRFELYRR